MSVHCCLCGASLGAHNSHSSSLCESCAAAEHEGRRTFEEYQAQCGNPHFQRKDRISISAIRAFVKTNPEHPIAFAWAEMLGDADMSTDPDCYYSLAEYLDEAEECQAENCNDIEWDDYLVWVGDNGGWPDA